MHRYYLYTAFVFWASNALAIGCDLEHFPSSNDYDWKLHSSESSEHSLIERYVDENDKSIRKITYASHYNVQTISFSVISDHAGDYYFGEVITDYSVVENDAQAGRNHYKVYARGADFSNSCIELLEVYREVSLGAEYTKKIINRLDDELGEFNPSKQ